MFVCFYVCLFVGFGWFGLLTAGFGVYLIVLGLGVCLGLLALLAGLCPGCSWGGLLV